LPTRLTKASYTLSRSDRNATYSPFAEMAASTSEPGKSVSCSMCILAQRLLHLASEVDARDANTTTAASAARPRAIAATRLHRRHVCRGPEDGAAGARRSVRAVVMGRRRSRARLQDCFGHAEIADHGVPRREEHVVRLDVAMDDSARVGVRQRVTHIAQDEH